MNLFFDIIVIYKKFLYFYKLTFKYYKHLKTNTYSLKILKIKLN